MKKWSVEALHQIRKEEQKNLQIIDVIDGHAYDYKSIFSSEEEALEHIRRDIDKLITDTYDFFPGVIHFDSNMILCVFYHKKKKDIIGTIALSIFSEKQVDFIELGLSLIAKKYRKMGFQSVEARRIREFAYYFLKQGNPFYLSARMASAATQLQVQRGVMPNAHGKIVNVAYPKGFLSHYIANKDPKGNFLLEFGLFYDAWPTLDQIIQKIVHLPKIAQIKGFHIFQTDFRQDIEPLYHDIVIKDNQYIKYGATQYNWTVLKPYLKLFGDFKSLKTLHSSKNIKFLYSELAAPDQNNLAIAIESIESLDFIDDFSEKMKSINFTLQVSNFQKEEEMVANLAVMDILIENNFAPICVYDILYRKERIRIALFSRWQNIVLQPYFEFLHHYHSVFKIFWHDCNVQGLTWDPKIEVLDKEKIEGRILVEKFKTIL
ncbi:MAG: hypothetical protein DRO88_07765 [Promethearchaeia archaeon]|nr:MAG: hypothetical protein DRO88_07765 [Candidatus Lokiarchaeia archaeon]